MILFSLSLLLAFALGFSAHRAGICTVAAVGEVMTSGTARTFLSFLKVVAWVVLVNGIAALTAPELLRPYMTPAITLGVIAGGFLFGLGAAMNGGCSFSTLSKLAQGELHMALTLPGFVAGAIAATSLNPDFEAFPVRAFALAFDEISPLIIAALAIWGVIELGRLLVEALRNGLVGAITRKRYRLSSAAAFIGLASGFLYLINGRWAYSTRIIDFVSGNDAAGFVGTVGFYLILALLFGAVVSAITSRQLKISFASDKWYRNLLGGFLMGFGALLVPGGNGKLMLQDLPHFSTHALVAYLAMVFGIALFLMLQKQLFGSTEIVICDGDECRIEKN